MSQHKQNLDHHDNEDDVHKEHHHEMGESDEHNNFHFREIHGNVIINHIHYTNDKHDEKKDHHTLISKL